MLLIIGLDGADWSLLNPLLEEGHLPHLAGLQARGNWGLLRSTIRPESSTAWASFATGVNPGRHGVFGFAAHSPQSYETGLHTAATIRYASFWQRAAAAGRRLALLNVPMTYPPQPFPNGALVAGMLTPSLHNNFTHPPELRQRLLAAVPGYTINVDRAGLSLRRFIQETTRAIEARGRAAQWLLSQDDWDALVVVFTATDRLQHYTLHLLAPGHPLYDAAAARPLLPELIAAYRAIDAAVGALLAAAGPEATVIVLSDHGFAPCARAFFPNTWLEAQGLLVRSTQAAQTSAWQRLRRQAALRRLKNSIPMLRHWRRPPPAGAHLAGVDWTRTRAVYSPVGGIRLNVRGREPQGLLDPQEAEGLRDELVARLGALIDPATGKTALVDIYRREELYTGPYVEHAPDLILEPRRADADAASNTLIASGFAPSPLAASGDMTGNHTLTGVFLAAGPGIPAGSIAGAHLIDLAPTLLHALDLPVPADLEGRVLPLWDRGRPVLREEGGQAGRWQGASGRGQASGLSAGEQAELEERLRMLGYL